MNPNLSKNRQSVTVHIPLTFHRHGGRKQVITPRGVEAWACQPTEVDSTLVKAIARAHRWQAILAGGAYASAHELARAERINLSYLARVLRLTLLAPEITEAIIDGRHDRERVTLSKLMRPFPASWGEQAVHFGMG